MIRRIKHTLKIEKEKDLLKKAIDIYTSIFMETTLTQREKEYFLELILLNKDGIDLMSKHATAHLKDKLNFKGKNDRGVWIYRQKLKKKGWIIQTKDSIILLPTFDLSKNNIKDFRFNISISNESID